MSDVVGARFGVRATPVARWPVARTFDQVMVDGMVVRIKVGGGRAKPEFDDVALIATKTGAAVDDVASRAEEAWRLARRDVAGEPPHGDDRSPA